MKKKCVAEMMENVLHLMETNHKTSSKYHPQANGLREHQGALGSIG
jgi:hypothetical protein